MSRTVHHLAHLLAIVAVMVTALIPSGGMVMCNADNGHSEVEFAHPFENCGTEAVGSMTASNSEVQAVVPNCSDTRLAWITEVTLRQGNNSALDIFTTIPSPLLFVLTDASQSNLHQRFDGGNENRLISQAFPIALRVVVLLV